MNSGVRIGILKGALENLVVRKIDLTSEQVLRVYLRQRNYPHWTAFYIPRGQVKNDLWGKSHFNLEVDGENYHVLRTGAFPFIKFHVSKRPVDPLIHIQDYFFTFLKVINFGNTDFVIRYRRITLG